MAGATTPWLVWLILLPLIGAPLSFVWRRRAAAIALATAAAVLVCTLGLCRQLLAFGPQRHAVGGWGAPLGIDLYADGLSALLLGLTTLLGVLVSVYATGYFGAGESEEGGRHVYERAYFWPLWLFLWGALNALFLAADVFNLYVTLELLGLAAVGLAALGGTAQALQAAMRYLLVGMLGSLSYLLGVALLYAEHGTVDLQRLGAVLQAGPVAWSALALMSAGLLAKTALFPLHFWLPAAHASAPAPVSALLSALVVKASFYLLLRLWLEPFGPLIGTGLAELLGLLGACAVLWGALQALRQERLKLLVAYSTVAQLGYLFIAVPLIAHGGDFTAWGGAAYWVIAHGCAKAAMFLAAGTILHTAGHDRISELAGIGQRLPVTMYALALAGVSLLGMPPSGGFIAKWMLLNAAFVTGQWWWGVVIIAGSLIAAGYVARMLLHAFTPATWISYETPVPRRMEWSALFLAALAVVLGFTAPQPLALLRVGAPFDGPTLQELTP